MLGRTRKVDVLIYKVDRLGDWLLAEPAIARIVADAQARRGTVAVWAASESAALRDWRRPDFHVETFALEPSGLLAKLVRALSVVRLLAVYRAKTLICLRHSPEPIRDFVLAHAEAGEIHALSWRIFRGPLGVVPFEILRHQAILAGVGLAPHDVRELLPRLPGRNAQRSTRVIMAPFSSSSIKDWRDDAWCNVAAGLAGRGLQFELWVGSRQRAQAKEFALKLAQRVGGGNVTVSSGALAELAEAMDAAALVLTVDTFAAQLAVSMDAPMVSLIGGGQYGDFGPWRRSSRQRWVTNPLPCFGCDWHCTRSRIECLVDITSLQVLSEAEDVLRLEMEGTHPVS
jgi:hypothetical protein